MVIKEEDQGERSVSTPLPYRGGTTSPAPTMTEDSSNSSISSHNVGGTGVKELVDAVKNLQILGVDASIPLPNIVVVGDQSAGKSSFIEAISEIQVPRKAGTCTRVPFQINLRGSDSPDSAWKCSVYLLKKFTLAKDIEEQHRPRFYPWVETVECERIPFADVSSKKELETVLLRAQLAILNPNDNHKTYVNLDVSGDSHPLQEKFSPNVISLDITAPGLNNLSFFDLPGVVNQMPDRKEDYLIHLVTQIVEKYAANPNTLVVLALSMETDRNNSTAGRIITQLPGCVDRCLGVLTKPDRMQKGGDLEAWRRILSGETFRLRYGHYVTKQPSQLELANRISHQDARLREQEFFETKEPWASDFARFKSRFGTKSLQDELSERLTSMILESLPNIQARVVARRHEIDDELNAYPEPPDDASRIITEKIWALVDKVHRNISTSEQAFMTSWKEATAMFQTQVLDHMEPTLSKPKRPETFTISSDEGTTPPPKTPNKKKKPTRPTSTPARESLKKAKTVADANSNASRLGRCFTLDQIRSAINRYSDHTIPNMDNSQAFQNLALSCNENWAIPMNEYLNNIRAALEESVRSALNEALQGYEKTEFYRETARVLEVFLTQLVQEQDKANNHFLRIERYMPMTRNSSLTQYQNDELAALRTSRFEERAKMFFDKEEKQIDRKISNDQRNKRKATAEFERQLGDDPYDSEIMLLAKVWGYYHVSALRFIDNITGSTRADLLQTLKKEQELRTQLEKVLPRNDDGKAAYRQACSRLLAEDDETETRRLNLKREKERLVEAQTCLDALADKYRGSYASQGPSEEMEVDSDTF